ncbi:unnamed protein product [Nesidiocoris tenuis]|uniref:Reverse transcriptase domain-containing protein n=1 Tax=Nesidiocoris tenuis TaxID=355587 RepID=A0A6H5GVK6_9HEMI|nr:unnamed protein product [Nesidiocoris tenuis]
MAARTGLLVLNTGETPTFQRAGQQGTTPDISLASEGLAGCIKDWVVLDDYTASDHQYISFRTETGPPLPLPAGGRRRPKGWNVRKLDVAALTEMLKMRCPALDQERGIAADAEDLVNNVMRFLHQACDAAMPRKAKPKSPPVYWWTEEIARLRQACRLSRRRALRAAARRGQHHEVAVEQQGAYREARRQLRRAINVSKRACWEKVVADVDADLWGLGYKIVNRKLCQYVGEAPMDEGAASRIVDTLFPSHPARVDTERHLEADSIPLFTREELEKAIMSLKSGKAPGPDGIPVEVLKIAVKVRPELLLTTFNACLTAGLFPVCWKRAKLVLIPKGGGDPNSPSGRRPLCMLDTTGKGLEKLLLPRMLAAIHASGDLSPRQHGFRTGHSTIGALSEVVDALRKTQRGSVSSRSVGLLVTLDVKNAFNSARWKDMLEALEGTFKVPEYILRVLRSYLKDRTLEYETAQGWRRRDITAGAAQGSILGPTLWNAAYDGLLRLEMPEEVTLVGYADDVAAVILGRTLESAQIKLERVMRRVGEWMSDHGLSLALQKTEVVIITRKRIQTLLPVRVDSTELQTSEAVRYLGVMVDTKLKFGVHIRRAADKAAKMTTALSRLMANTRGPRASRRRVLMSVVHSILLYGVEVWADSLSIAYHRKRLAAVQRRCALRVACAYRTVSHEAVMVVAGAIPIHLLAKERKEVYQKKGQPGTRATKKEESREETLGRWQEEWDAAQKGQWTKRLIPRLGPWLGRSQGEVDFFLTQLLTGHGAFRAYLHKMGRARSPMCLHCSDAQDDACHTFFVCERWAGWRRAVEDELGRLQPETLVLKMIESDRNWKRVASFARAVLTEKRMELASQGPASHEGTSSSEED